MYEKGSKSEVMTVMLVAVTLILCFATCLMKFIVKEKENKREKIKVNI